MDFVLDGCFKDCHNNYLHIYKYKCLYDMKFENVESNELIDFTVSGKNMDLYHLNKKLKVARERGFIFIHINKLTIKIFSHRRYLKHRNPIMQRKVFRVISQNGECVENFCNDMENPFHFACQKWINQLN